MLTYNNDPQFKERAIAAAAARKNYWRMERDWMLELLSEIK